MSIQPIDKAITIRQPANALLVVDTNDSKLFSNVTGIRTDTKTPAQVYINNQRPLLNGYFTRVALTEMNINWATPNVNKTNNTLTMEVDSSSGLRGGRLVIPEGFYKPTELAVAIMEQFIAVFGTYLNYEAPGNPLFVGYNARSQSFTLESQSGTTGSWNNFQFIIKSKVGRLIQAPVYLNALPALDDDLTEMMGIVPTQQFESGISTLNGGFASMMYSPYIDVVSNLLTKNQNVSDGDSAITYTSSKLARVYFANEKIEANTEDNIPGVRPFSFRREFITPKQIQWNNTENLDFVDLSVLDHKGRLIYVTPTTVINSSPGDPDEITVGNQANIQFTLLVSES